MSEAKRMEIAPELVRRAQAGDEEAFNQLYEQTGTAIYRTIFSMVQNEATAWDIHQNTYLLAWRGLSRLEKPEAFLSWLRRIAVNEAVKELTKEDPLSFSELTGSEDEEPQFAETRSGYQPEMELDKQEAARLVREILDQLPQRQRLIVGMYYYEGYSIKEIAERLQVTQGTVKTQLHLGRKRVEAEVRRLEAEGVKLYGMAPIDFLAFLLRRQEGTKLAGGQAALANTAAYAGEPAVFTAKAVGRGFFHTVLGKLTAVTLSTAVVAGGIAGYHALQNRQQPTLGDYRPTEPVTSTEPLPTVTEAVPVVLESDPPSTTAPMETQAQTEPQPEATEETQKEPQPEAQEALFFWSDYDFDESILAAICSETDAREDVTPTVIWNEGTENQLLIYPRYEDSTISASRITYGEKAGYTLEAPTYSTICSPGDCIGASLERPEQNPAWLITVSTPDGREGSWLLAYNNSGTPSYEFVADHPAGAYLEDKYSDERETAVSSTLAEKALNWAGYSFDLSRGGGYSSELIGESLLRSMERLWARTEENAQTYVWNELCENDSASWTIAEQQRLGDSFVLEAAEVQEMYMNGVDMYVNGLRFDENGMPIIGELFPYGESVAGKVQWQAEQFAEVRLLRPDQKAEDGEELHFDLYNLLVYNPTLSAKTVSITVNGEDAGEFSLTEGDFFSWIPLEYENLPGDQPIRVEVRVLETYFGTPEQAVLGLWPSVGSNLLGGR